MRYPLFGWLLYFAFESSGMGLVYFSDIWLKIWVSNVEGQISDLCDSGNASNLSISVNETKFLPSVDNCETVNLMDLPYSHYYKNVYLGNSYFHIQSFKKKFRDLSCDSIHRYRFPNNLSSNVRHDKCLSSQQDDPESHPCASQLLRGVFWRRCTQQVLKRARTS